MTRSIHERGFTIVELMVAATIFLVISLAIFEVLSVNEGQKQSTTSVNNIDQAGDYGLYQFGMLLRSAGAGLTASYQQTFGCRINEVETKPTAATILPVTASFPAPFTNVYSTIGSPRVAPVLIIQGASSVVGSTGASADTSDVIIVMESKAGFDQLGISSIQAPSASTLYLQNSVTINPGDLLLISDEQTAAGTMAPCLIEEATTAGTYTPSTAAGVVPLAGTFYTSAATDQGLASYTSASTVMDLGNIYNSPANPPDFVMLGVGNEESASSGTPTTTTTSSALYSYDILQLNGAGTAPAPFVDNVFEVHALYGVDTTGSGTVGAWENPGTAPWNAATLMNGSVVSNANLAKIMAIRIALVLRSALPEKNPVQASTAQFTMFADLGTTYSVTCKLCSSQTNYRWRVFDTIIPVRNSIYLGQ